MPTLSAFKTVAFDMEREVHCGSDVDSLHFTTAGLTITVLRDIEDDGQVRGLRVFFPSASAARYLDEGDLARYWASDGFVRNRHVLEVIEGGWADEENDLQGFATERREWLVVTGQGCVSVFAELEPTIHEHAWRRDA